MSSVMAPISMHQAVNGWHNQQLDNREPISQSRRYGSFSTPATRDINDLERGDEKPPGLTLKEIFSSSTMHDIKRESTHTHLDTKEDIQNTTNGTSFSSEDAPNEPDSANPLSAVLSDPGDAGATMRLSAASAEIDDSHFDGDTSHGETVDMIETTPEQQEPEEQPKTASERRAEKRKMKRFRLTHNQTRFLMSEFTRQAHPDAAHRERLSREIPGLSPRQVQVWFQNRRAKLKRLTNDDRERMLKSRALPEDFDMTQALHSPYGSQPQTSTAPLASTGNYYHPSSESGIVGPMTLDGVKRSSDDEYVTSPLSAASTYSTYFSSLATAPTPTSEAANLSPTSTACDRSGIFTSIANAPVSAPRNINLFSRSGSFSNTFSPTSYPQVHRLSSQEPAPRIRTGSLASPLRGSGAYTPATLDYSKSNSSMGLYSGSTFESAGSQVAGNNETDTYNANSHGNAMQGFDNKTNLRLRTSPTSLSAELNIKGEFKEGSNGLQSAPLAMTQEDQLSPLSAHAHYSPNPFNVAYTHQNTSTMSLPASFYPFTSTTKAQDGFSTSYDGGVNLQHTLDSLRDRAYTTPLGFSSDK